MASCWDAQKLSHTSHYQRVITTVTVLLFISRLQLAAFSGHVTFSLLHACALNIQCVSQMHVCLLLAQANSSSYSTFHDHTASATCALARLPVELKSALKVHGDSRSRTVLPFQQQRCPWERIGHLQRVVSFVSKRACC